MSVYGRSGEDNSNLDVEIFELIDYLIICNTLLWLSTEFFFISSKVSNFVIKVASLFSRMWSHSSSNVHSSGLHSILD